MGVPYSTPPNAGLNTSSGSNFFAIPFATRAFIHRILVGQTSGTPGAFTVALYSNAGAAGGHPQSESAGPYTGTIPPDMYRVTPDMPGTSGVMRYFNDQSTGGAGFLYCNQDPPGGRPHNVIYCVITHSLGSNIKFAVSIAGEVFGD